MATILQSCNTSSELQVKKALETNGDKYKKNLYWYYCSYNTVYIDYPGIIFLINNLLTKCQKIINFLASKVSQRNQNDNLHRKPQKQNNSKLMTLWIDFFFYFSLWFRFKNNRQTVLLQTTVKTVKLSNLTNYFSVYWQTN